MSDFVDSEAEESGEELDDTREQDENGEDEEDGETEAENEVADLIDDNPIEEEEEDGDSGDSEDDGPTKKRSKIDDDDEDDDVDDDDLDLIAENTGIKLKKKKHSRVKILDDESDDEEEEPENERDAIAHDIFDKEDDDEDSQEAGERLSRPSSRQSAAAEYTAIENIDEEGSDDEVDEIDDFIVDDDGTPSKKKGKKKRGVDYDDGALAEAQDIFGLEFDLSELDVEMEEDDEDVDDDDLDEEELMERREQKKVRKKAGKKKLTEVFEPAELERGYMTTEDNKIKITDIPERFQKRAVPVTPAEEGELLEEAEWIYKQAFMQPPITQQAFQDSNDPRRNLLGFEAKPVTAIPRIKAALSFMRKEMFEVPFIAMYRKEYVAPELKQDDLWKVYEWDEKWIQFTTRKGNMKKLFEAMQAYQFEYTKQMGDLPLEEGFRLLDQEDIDRLENAQTVQELMDVYMHFQLYYGDDIPDMRQWRATQRRKKKKTKKKIIQVKKMKSKKVKKALPTTEGDSVPVKPNDTPNGEGQVNELATKPNDESGDPEKGVQESQDMEVDEKNSEVVNSGDNSGGVNGEDGEVGVNDGSGAEKARKEGGMVDATENEKTDGEKAEGDKNKSTFPAESVGRTSVSETRATVIDDVTVTEDVLGTDDALVAAAEPALVDLASEDCPALENFEKEASEIPEDVNGCKDGETDESGYAEGKTENGVTGDKGEKSDSEKGNDAVLHVEQDSIIDTSQSGHGAQEQNDKGVTDKRDLGATEGGGTNGSEPTRDPETGEIIMKIEEAEEVKEPSGETETTQADASAEMSSDRAGIVDGVGVIDFIANAHIVGEDEDKEEGESEYEDQEIEVTDSEDEPEEEEAPLKRKLPRRRDLYIICKDNGLAKIASKFGLTAEEFGENMRDNYQRHEPVQYQQEPLEVAVDFICNTFPSAEAVLSGARHMVAVQISRDPLVKQTVRQVFYERAKIVITPTAKGKKDIGDWDEQAPFKYLKNKPVNDLQGEQFLKMWVAEQNQLVTIKIGIDIDVNVHGGYTFLDEIKQLYHRDEFSHLVQEWNKQRAESLSVALNKVMYPFLEKELKAKLLVEAKDFAMQACKMKLRNWISVAPYQPDSAYNEDGEFGVENESSYCRVLGFSYSTDRGEASFGAIIDTDGQVMDHLRVKYISTWRTMKQQDGRDNRPQREDRQQMLDEIERFKDFVKRHQPRVIAIAAENILAERVVRRITDAMTELEQEQQMAHVYVELVDGEVARIFQNSPRGESEFREYPPLLRHAVSIARRIQEPLVEFAGLTDAENELQCLSLHPYQEYLDEDILRTKLHVEFISQVNMVGVDINRCLEFPHRQVLINHLCGLGPRKAALLMRTLRSQGSRLENRSQLVTVCEMGLQVFLNCAGFIRIEPSEINNDKYEVLDGTRIHPETYDWPRKMAIDALEYDEGMDDSNPSSAVEEILEQPDRLKDLDLDAFAEELARQGYGNRQITLYDIRDELINRFKDHRTVFTGIGGEERFRLLTSETQKTLYVGIMITCKVRDFAYKKPTREELDSANPTRNDDTNLWTCPFCLQDNFPDLSEVWTHFDNGSCRGKAVGVKTSLANGLEGFIHTKNISDKKVNRPEDRVKIGLTLYCRVLRIDYDRFSVELTCKSSDLTDAQKKFSPPKDLYFDQEMHDKDRKQAEATKLAEQKKTTYLKRVIAHSAFKNITFKDAEKMLEQMDQGECVVRPSSKGVDHLTATWKVTGKIYQHIDIREEQKENDFSIGKSLWIDNEEYEDLDEILTRHISPLAVHARELCSHKYFKETDGTRQKLEEQLVLEKRKNPGRIPYFFTVCKQYPGKFMIGYMPRNKPRVEFVSITVDGFKYRGRIHANTNNLLKWFKEHFRDPVPGVGTPSSMRRTPYGQTPMSMMGSVAGTPYTPGSTPSDLISTDEAAKLMQQAFPPAYPNGFAGTPGTTPLRSTPGYSTPAFSTPGGFTPQINNLGQVDNNTDATSSQGSDYTPDSSSKFTPNPRNFAPNSVDTPSSTRNFTPDSITPQTPITPTPNRNFTPDSITPQTPITPNIRNYTPDSITPNTPSQQSTITPSQQSLHTPSQHSSMQNFTPSENFTPQSTYTPSVHSNFTPPVHGNFTPAQGNYTPHQNFAPPNENNIYTTQNYTPSEQYTPSENSFQPPPPPPPRQRSINNSHYTLSENQNYTPVENFTPPQNFTPQGDGYTPDSNFSGHSGQAMEFVPRMDFPPPPGGFPPPPPNGFAPWMPPPPGNFIPPSNFSPGNMDNNPNNYNKNKIKHERVGGQKRKKQR